jgi:hypothetical protein
MGTWGGPDKLRVVGNILLLAGLVASPACYTGIDAGRDSGAGDTADGGDEGGDDGDEAPENLEPAPASLRLLLPQQYVASIRELFGDEAAEVATPPPAPAALNGFEAIGAAQLSLNDTAIAGFETSAQRVAEIAVRDEGRMEALRGCTPSGATDAACHEAFVTRLGRLAFRRPLTTVEVEQYTAVAMTAAAELGTFDDGTRIAIATMLQSPNFLYQVEIGEPDPDDPTMRRLGGYEVATRMAFFLTGSTPTEDLLDAAEAGELDTASGVREAARELLQREGAREALASFASELLHLRQLDNLPKDLGSFPSYHAELAASMRSETLALIEHVVWDENGDFLEILDADYTFVDANLAGHYGMDAEVETLPVGMTRVVPPPEQKRGGILGHAGVLSLLAHVSSSSPSVRGKFVRETLMCENIPAPPPDVPTDLPSSDDQTTRERLEQHMEIGTCAGCHSLMDPIGFGLEIYDGIGAFRTTENDRPIDAVSEFAGQSFEGARELGAILRSTPTVPLCLVRNLYRHGTGHLETLGELEQLQLVTAAFTESGHSLQDALVDLVASPAFRIVGEPQ